MTTRTVSPLSLTHDLAGTVTLICVLTRGMGHGFYHDRYSQALWWRRLLIFPFIPRACPSLSPTSQPPLPDTYYPVPTLICKHDVFLLKKKQNLFQTMLIGGRNYICFPSRSRYTETLFACTATRLNSRLHHCLRLFIASFFSSALVST